VTTLTSFRPCSFVCDLAGASHARPTKQEKREAKNMIAAMKDYYIIGQKANATSLAVVACAMALHGGERYHSDREAKRRFGVPVKTDVRLWTGRLARLEELGKFHARFSTAPAAGADASTPSPPAYRRPPPVPGRKRGRPPVSSYTPEEMIELQQRREAKRHHEATWRERAAARDADRAAAQAEKAAAREAARAATKKAPAAWGSYVASEAEWEAHRAYHAAALKQLRMADAVEAQEREQERRRWYDKLLEADHQPKRTCAECGMRTSDGRVDDEHAYYCSQCWQQWERPPACSGGCDRPSRECDLCVAMGHFPPAFTGELADAPPGWRPTCGQCCRVISDGRRDTDGVWYCHWCWRWCC
jgi:hypothetical protein